MADDVLRQGVQGITDLITVPGIVNLDFADVRTIMRDAGSALMGIGVGQGENRAAEAARTAVSSPLLESSIEGATGILLNITGPPDLGLFEVNEAAEVVTSAADQNANVIFGAVIDDQAGAEVRVTVIATGLRGRSGAAAPARRPVESGSALGRAGPEFDRRRHARRAVVPPPRALSRAPRARWPDPSDAVSIAGGADAPPDAPLRRSTSPPARASCRSPAGRCPCSTRA